ncbi:basic blue protein [Striga asiatica]|uniref:Basic blue protein n=1 Tax=Striga asiatica TaxID=4170 RepID=A0A5A7NW77_STRAF|nr:basic blue protein [Striga asiatica]
MGGERGSALAAALVMLVAVAALAEAKEYNVTWSLPAIPPLLDVTKDDTVNFVFDATDLDLVKVPDKSSFDACNGTGAQVLQSKTSAAPTVPVRLNQGLNTGHNYFICDIANICSEGNTMITINVN